MPKGSRATLKYISDISHVIPAIVAVSILACVTPFACADGGRVSADVVHVHDGDSITVRYDMGERARVRLIGIDAPELTDTPRARASVAEAAASRAYLAALLGNERVFLEYDVEKADSYGRTLAYVYTAGGVMANEEMLRGGYARLMTVPPNLKYEARFRAAQEEARTAGCGLWK